MSWNSNYEARVEFIAQTAPAICGLKTDVRTRCDHEHDFNLDGAGVHDDETFDSNHFKPGLFLQRLGDVELDQEFEFSDALASITVSGLQNAAHLPVGVDTYGFLHMKIEGLESVGATVYPTSANQHIRVGGDDTVWLTYFQLLGLASYTGFDDSTAAYVYPVGYVSGGPYDSFFGEQELRYGLMYAGGSDLIQDVRLVASGHYNGSALAPHLYMSLTIHGDEIIAPIRVPFGLTHATIYGPWVDVRSHGWTFVDDISDIADSYLTLDARQFGAVNNLHLTQARLELRVGAAELQDYHVSLVRESDDKLFTSSQPQSSWNKDWFWLPLDVINSSSLGGVALTNIRLYKDNYTTVNGLITVKELVLYGR